MEMVDKDKDDKEDEFIRITFEGSIKEYIKEFIDLKQQQLYFHRPRCYETMTNQIIKDPIT